MKKLVIILAGLLGLWFFFFREKTDKNADVSLSSGDINQNDIVDSGIIKENPGTIIDSGTTNPGTVRPGTTTPGTTTPGTTTPGTTTPGTTTPGTTTPGTTTPGTTTPGTTTPGTTTPGTTTPGTTTPGTTTPGTDREITANKPVVLSWDGPLVAPGSANLVFTDGREIKHVLIKISDQDGNKFFEQKVISPLPATIKVDIPRGAKKVNVLYYNFFNNNDSRITNFSVDVKQLEEPVIYPESVIMTQLGIFYEGDTAYFEISGGKHLTKLDILAYDLTSGTQATTPFFTRTCGVPYPFKIYFNIPQGVRKIQLWYVSTFENGQSYCRGLVATASKPVDSIPCTLTPASQSLVVHPNDSPTFEAVWGSNVERCEASILTEGAIAPDWDKYLFSKKIYSNEPKFTATSPVTGGVTSLKVRLKTYFLDNTFIIRDYVIPVTLAPLQKYHPDLSLVDGSKQVANKTLTTSVKL